MNAVGEPHLFQVFLQGLPFGRRAIAPVVLVNRFERTAHGEVVFEILVEKDVPAALGSLGEVIDQFLLRKRKLLERMTLMSSKRSTIHGASLFDAPQHEVSATAVTVIDVSVTKFFMSFGFEFPRNIRFFCEKAAYGRIYAWTHIQYVPANAPPRHTRRRPLCGH